MSSSIYTLAYDCGASTFPTGAFAIEWELGGIWDVEEVGCIVRLEGTFSTLNAWET
jgi:hypothetical protein